MLFVEVSVLCPVNARVLVVNDVVIFIQDIEHTFNDGHTIDIFVFRFIIVDESVPGPVNGREDEEVLKEGVDDVPESEGGVCELQNQSNEAEPIERAQEHLDADTVLSFLVELNNGRNVQRVEGKSGDVSDPVEEGVSGSV